MVVNVHRAKWPTFNYMVQVLLFPTPGKLPTLIVYIILSFFPFFFSGLFFLFLVLFLYRRFRKPLSPLDFSTVATKPETMRIGSHFFYEIHAANIAQNDIQIKKATGQSDWRWIQLDSLEYFLDFPGWRIT